MLLSRTMLTVLLIVYTKQLQGRRQQHIYDSAFLKHSMAQDDSSQDRGVYSSLLYSGSDLSRHGSACQPHLLSMIRAKDLLLLLLLLLTVKKTQRWKRFPKLPVWSAYCCWVFQWGSGAVLWSSRWPCAALWLKTRHLPLRSAVRQCDAVETRSAAAERRRSVGPSLASSSFSTSFSLFLSHVPRTHAVHCLTVGSTHSSWRFNKFK